MTALRTHVGRLARRDVRERDTWWARVTAAPSSEAAPPVFPSRSRCPPPPPPPSPLRILVVVARRGGVCFDGREATAWHRRGGDSSI